jgi:hypothetical protein
MRKALLFSAVAVIVFFVTVETPVRPVAGFQVDFEPAAPVEMLRLSGLQPRLPRQESYVL